MLLKDISLTLSYFLILTIYLTKKEDLIHQEENEILIN